ncbi:MULTISPECIES: hypothetical protein [Hyphobacterium]|uniref:Yip1 domain-containing protein n=1 Tax=Hyphobacterium vulgare TaxID=1736751 RepID=A0ABV6ZUL8_9PROT
MTTSPKPRNDDVEDFVEDILGFNFRSFRTIYALFVKPRAVFQAYADRDREAYTPSLRIWLGIIGIQVLFSVIWGGYGGLLLSQWESGDTNVALIEQAMGGPIEEIARHYGDVANLLHAVLVGGMTGLSAFLIGAFNKSLHWTARINITFAILSVASVVGLLLLVVTAVTGHFTLMTWSLPVIALLYGITFYRGAPGILASTRTGAIVKGFLFSLTAILLVFLGGLIMALIGFVYAAIRVNGG